MQSPGLTNAQCGAAQTAEACREYGELYDNRRGFATPRLAARLDATLDDGGDDDDYFNDGSDTQSTSGGDAWLAPGGSSGGEDRAAGSMQQPGGSSDLPSSGAPSGHRTNGSTRCGSSTALLIDFPPTSSRLGRVSSQFLSILQLGWCLQEFLSFL